MSTETYDVVVIGGGPSGATAADKLPQLRLVSQRSLRRSVASAVGIVMV
jgi:flavin-dependent dehydrogenase